MRSILNSTWKVLTGSLIGLLSVTSAAAQEHPDGFFLNTPLSIGSGYDSGFVAGSQTLNDTVTLIELPTLAWYTSTHRSQFSFDYQAEGEVFARRSDFDAFNQTADIRFTHRINSRWSFDLGDLFLSTMDPTRKLENSLILLPRGRFDQNTLFSDLVYRVNGTTKVTFRFDNALTIIALPQLQGRLDNITSAGTVSLDKIFSSRHQITTSYSFLHVTPLSPDTAGSASNVHLLLLGYTLTVNPSLLIRGTAGLVEGASSAFNGAAAVEKKVGGVWIALGYQRYLGFFGGFTPVGGVAPGTTAFANGITPGSVYQVFSLRASGQVTKRIALNGDLQKALSGQDALGRPIRSVIGQAHVSYKINDHLAFFLQADHFAQNINRFFDQSLDRNRYFGGIEVAWARPQEADRGRFKHGKVPQDAPPLPEVPEEKTDQKTDEK
jgi:hypothetical protein